MVRWFGTNTDINDQIEIEEQLRLANAALQHSNEELERFTYVVSHDLQSPLATIGSIIQLLARRHGEAMGQEGRKMLDMLTSDVARTSKLISDLLNYCRLTAKDSSPEKAIDCNIAYSSAIMNLQRQIAETGAVIRATNCQRSVQMTACFASSKTSLRMRSSIAAIEGPKSTCPLKLKGNSGYLAFGITGSVSI